MDTFSFLSCCDNDLSLNIFTHQLIAQKTGLLAISRGWAQNPSYQQATDLLLSLKKTLKGNDPQGNSELLNIMIGKIIKQHKAKRNMMKLLKTHFAECF